MNQQERVGRRGPRVCQCTEGKSCRNKERNIITEEWREGEERSREKERKERSEVVERRRRIERRREERREGKSAVHPQPGPPKVS